MTDWAEDLRHAVRGLRKRPGFAAAAVVTIALGIGATTLIFSVLNSVLLNPLPYADADRLVRIVHAIGGTDQPYFSDAVYDTYAQNTQTLEAIGVWMPETTAAVTGQGVPEEVRTLAVSHGVLTTLGVAPERGRWFTTAEDTPGAPDVVILTYGYWQRKFGGDPAIINRVVTIDARPHRIVGVMPASFGFGGEPDVIRPLRINRGRLIPAFRLLGVARLKPGVTLERANDDAGRMLRIWLTNTGQADPAFQARYLPALRPLEQDIVGNIGRTLWVLMGAIGLVLLMACANVANLLLVRADARRLEFAIRAALGARRARIARQLLVESATLAVLGGVLGVGLAYAGLRVLLAAGPANLPRLSEISIDGVVLAFAVVLSLVSGLLFGIIPVVRYARPQLSGAIAAGRRNASPGRDSQRSQQTLVAIQMALAFVLLVSAGLMIRSFSALRHVELGITSPEGVQTFGLSIPPAVVADPERVTRTQQEILDKIAAIPGVTSAAFSTRLPMGGNRSSAALTVENTADDGLTPPNRHVKIISPGTFATLGTPLVAGRDFTWTDLYDGRDIAIVSENMARELWGSPADALGKRVREYYGASGPWREIVGVVGDVHDDGAHQAPPTTVYWPARRHTVLFGVSNYQPRRVSVVVRSARAGTESLLQQLRDAVWSVQPTLPLAQIRTLDEIVARSMAQTSFALVMLAIAGAMALFLGIFGLYAALSYAVSQRAREIGIRLALGAQPHQIRTLFLRRGLVLTSAGMAIGLVTAAGFTPILRSLVFGVSPLDLATFTVTPVALTAAAMLASYLPARRAVSIDPVDTLRSE